jgi:hypothetical protein
MQRILVICLWLGIVSIVNGCAVGPSPTLSGTLAPYWTLSPPETSQGRADERPRDAAQFPVVSVSTQHVDTR